MGRNGKKGANQHNAKHENGIVAPGKRVNKQNSNGHGHVGNGSVDASIGLSTSSSAKDTDHTAPVTQSAQHTFSHDGPGPDSPARTTRSGSNPKLLSHHQSQSDSASEDVEDWTAVPAKAIQQQQKGNVSDISVTKQVTTHEGGPVKIGLTVLKSSTTADILAILVLLLSVPSALIHSMNMLFATLTFTYPHNSSMALPSLSDITSSFSPEAPSVVVLLLLDLIAICTWSVIPWPHLQAIILDCAQANVATHVGGGHALSPASTDNLLYFTFLIILTNCGRYRRSILKWLHRTPLTRHLPIMESLEDLPVQSPYVISSNRSWFDTVKIWVALHILLQGLTKVVRTALNAPRESSLSGRSTDPEAYNNSTSTEAMEVAPPMSPSALKTKMSLQQLRDSKDKIANSKKRKKQANWSKSQQPLWAAVAAMKVKVFREREQSKATNEARVIQSSGTQSSGSSSLSNVDNKVWITSVLSDRVFFETGPMARVYSQPTESLENAAGANQAASFTVCVNGATWPSVKVSPLVDEEVHDGKTKWIGEIYGLSAANTYNVSWIRDDRDAEVYSEVVFTPSLPTDHTDIPIALPQVLRPPSPASPIATVRASISTYESQIEDLYAGRRRNHKDAKGNKVRLEKEVETLNEKSTRLGTTNKSFVQRQTQLENSIKQTDDATISVSEDINAYESIPEDVQADWQQAKDHWETSRNEQSRVQEDVQRTKEENRTTSTNAQTKELSERQKRDRLQTRVKKLATDLANLHNSSKNPDHHRANSGYATRATELDQNEAQAQFQLESLRQKNMDMFQESQNIIREVDHMEHIAYQNDAYLTNQNQARFAHDSRPITPEGDLPGTNPQMSGMNHASFHRPVMFSTPEMTHAIPANSGKGFANGFASSARHNGISARHRSQSALSGSSIYAEQLSEEDDDDEDPIPLMHKRRTGLSGSDGRSSGSGSPHVNAGTVPPPPIGSTRRQSPAQAGPPY